jgi:hypothetical protein
MDNVLNNSHQKPMLRSRTQIFVAFLWVPMILALIYFSFINPWQTAQDALAHLEPGPRFVIALEGSFSRNPGQEHRVQTYLALPDSLRTLNAYQISQDPERVQVRTVRYGLLVFISFYGTWISGSCWYLFRYGRH